MVITKKRADAMAEVIHYLKGIRQEDINKIPVKFLDYLNKNASKGITNEFDYTKPLKELKISDEARGIIGVICYNYWCENIEQKQNYTKKLNSNEKLYQEELMKKYNPDKIFNTTNSLHTEENLSICNIKKEKWYIRILSFFRKR